MGLFNRNKHTRVINDAIFGTLRQREDELGNCFEGNGTFELGQGKTATIPLVLYTGYGDPTPAQRDFYQRLQSNFQQRTAAMIPLIEKELKLWGKDVTVKDFNKEFTLATIIISAADEPPIAWEAILNTIYDTNHQLIIDFSGDEPVDILIDV